MLQSCPLLEPQSLTLMLKVIKNLSMSPVILDELQNCNAIEILTRILAENYDKEHGTEMSNQILTAMYNRKSTFLCFIHSYVVVRQSPVS